MRSLKKKIEKLRKKRKAITTKKKMKSSRKSQKTKSDVSRLLKKSSARDKLSSIDWKINSSIVEPSIEVKKSWNDSVATKPSSSSWTEVQRDKSFERKTSSWGKNDSFNESWEKNNSWSEIQREKSFKSTTSS